MGEGDTVKSEEKKGNGGVGGLLLLAGGRGDGGRLGTGAVHLC